VSVHLALTPDGRWDFSTAELVSAASAAGFCAVGINSVRVDDAAAEAYEVSGIRCHEVLALVVSDDKAATITAAERLADAAQVIDATWVLTVFTTPPTESTVRCCTDRFAEAGIGIAVEFSPLGPVSTITDGMDVVRAANHGRARAGLLIDSWHFCFGDNTFDDLAAVPLDDIAYVQFTDALEPLSDNLVRETLHRRALPGEGTLELDRFAATLLDRGWDGVVSVEVLSAELRDLPVDVLVDRLHETTAQFWC
jgi:sugar phosphate isomerase/epimerase